ncbi:MAG: tetratricopeptide repeat protein [Anaerolineales bacterium]|nr:tetratricopeptide repeat protein [Anaerolineales bacterium]
MDDILQNAIALIQKGDNRSAVRLLGRLLEQQPRNAEAWYWLSKTQNDPIRKRECLVRALRYQPGYAPARAEFESLEAQRSSSPSSTQPVQVLPQVVRTVSSLQSAHSSRSSARPLPVAQQAAQPLQRHSVRTWLWLSLMGFLIVSVLCLIALLVSTSFWQPIWDQWVGGLDLPMFSFLDGGQRLPSGLSNGYWQFDFQRPLPQGVYIGDLVLLSDGIFWFGYLRGQYRYEDDQTLALCVEPKESGAASTCFRVRVVQYQPDQVVLNVQLNTFAGEQWVEGLIYRKIIGENRRYDLTSEIVGRWQPFPLDHHTRIAQQRGGESSPDDVYLFTASGELWAGGRKISSYRVEDGMVRVPDYFGDFGERFQVDRLGDWMALVGQINKPALILSLKRVP